MNDLQKMNMQKTIDDVVNEFRQMLENELLPNESTKFLCIDTDGEVAILDSKQIPSRGSSTGHSQVRMLPEKLLKGREATTATMSWLFTKDSDITPPTRPSNTLGFIPDSARATRRALIPEI